MFNAFAAVRVLLASERFSAAAQISRRTGATSKDPPVRLTAASAAADGRQSGSVVSAACSAHHRDLKIVGCPIDIVLLLFVGC